MTSPIKTASSLPTFDIPGLRSHERGPFLIGLRFAHMQTFDLFNVGSNAPWEVEVELRDPEYRRDWYVIPVPAELVDENDSLHFDLFSYIDHYLFSTPYKLKAASQPRKR